ncbi:MAG: hypothetical protein K2X57_14705 [Xanthobacteraceae bacterium]|nr:hypothetical protein [Xanthobacteraceae bacterium]
MTRQELEEKLVRCLELAREYPDGPMSETIHDVEEEVREQLRSFQA